MWSMGCFLIYDIYLFLLEPYAYLLLALKYLHSILEERCRINIMIVCVFTYKSLKSSHASTFFAFNCQDINKCSRLNCNQICINKPRSFQCSWLPGYQLGSDNRTCLDINECVEQKPCDSRNGLCKNTLGSYQCSCKAGYKLLPNKKTC